MITPKVWQKLVNPAKPSYWIGCRPFTSCKYLWERFTLGSSFGKGKHHKFTSEFLWIIDLEIVIIKNYNNNNNNDFFLVPV